SWRLLTKYWRFLSGCIGDHAAADRRWQSAVEMAEHTLAIGEFDQQQHEWRHRRMRLVRHADDCVALHCAAHGSHSAFRMWTVTAAAVPPPLWVRPSRAFGTWFGWRPRSCITTS